MASISLGSFNAYNNSYGKYNVVFWYDSTVRNGTTITVYNARIVYTRVGNGYTSNAIITKGFIGSNTQNPWGQSTPVVLNPRYTNSPASMTHTLGNLTLTAGYTDTVTTCRVQTIGAGTATIWTVFAGSTPLDAWFDLPIPSIDTSCTNIQQFWLGTNPLEMGSNVTLNWSGATTANGTITGYDVDAIWYNGSTWSAAQQIKHLVTSGTSWTPQTNFPNIKVGDLVAFTVYTWNSYNVHSTGVNCYEQLSMIAATSTKINVGGVWKSGAPWVNVGGTWKKGIAYLNVGGVWKKGN